MKSRPRTDANRKADQKYRQKRVRVPLDFRVDDPMLALLDKLADRYGSRKAAIVAALKRLAGGRDAS